MNSPIEVSVGGQDAAIITKLGWPGTVDTYRVDIRAPEGLTAGMHPVRIAAAWISGLSAQMPVR